MQCAGHSSIYLLRRCALAAMFIAGAAQAQDRLSHETEHAHASTPKLTHFVQVGTASVYARSLQGQKTASGEHHDGDDLTAAHRTLPLGTTVRVTNLANLQSVVVRVNDRGPTLKSRIIDLSPAAAKVIGLRAGGKGLAHVRVELVDSQ